VAQGLAFDDQGNDVRVTGVLNPVGHGGAGPDTLTETEMAAPLVANRFGTPPSLHVAVYLEGHRFAPGGPPVCVYFHDALDAVDTVMAGLSPTSP
jgi:hypothetical protein